MKDRVFSGADLSEAVASAAANLGLPLAELRYVVLEAGTPGGRGLSPTPARIAVLLGETAAAGPARPAPRGRTDTDSPGASPRGRAGSAAEALDPRQGIVSTIRAIAEAGGLAVEAALEESAEAIVVNLKGQDRDFFLEPEGRAEVLRATEHLLHRLYGAALQPLSLRLDGEGFRERRDGVLAAEARRVAEAVRADGQARTMPSLNAYERRIVHMALQGEAGVTTRSSGEGAERRLTIAPAGAPSDGPAE